MSCHIITIYSSKGGVGKSFIASNVSINIYLTLNGNGLKQNKSVLLIDFSLPYSRDISSYLNIDDSKVKSISNLELSSGQYSKKDIQSLPIKHTSGISVVSVNDSTNPLFIITDFQIEQILNCFQEQYEMIIIDAGTGFSQMTKTILCLSTMIIIPYVKDTRFIDDHSKFDSHLMKQLSIEQKRVKIVSNKVDKGIVSDYGSIPYDKYVSKKMSKGAYPEKHERDLLTRAFDNVTMKILYDIKEFSCYQPTQNQCENVNLDELTLIIHEKLITSTYYKNTDFPDQTASEHAKKIFKQKIINMISEFIDSHVPSIPQHIRPDLQKLILDETLGLGPIQPLMEDKDVSEIMVNRFNTIFIEKCDGTKEQNEKYSFRSEEHLINIINKIAIIAERVFNIAHPIFEADYSDGSKVTAVHRSISPSGTTLVIRKPPLTEMSIKDLVGYETLTPQIAHFLKAAIISKLNIVISGGTKTGKTTLLKILSALIPNSERILVIEDTKEIRLTNDDILSFQSKPKNAFSVNNEVTIKDLLKTSLKNRPDRIIVGECRGQESFDMLQAMNTGHEGSLTTIHANSCNEALGRILSMSMDVGNQMSEKSIQELIGNAIHLIIQIKRFTDGSRRIVQLSELIKFHNDKNHYEIQDIFQFDPVQKCFISKGNIPKCLSKFKEFGIQIPKEIFWSTD